MVIQKIKFCSDRKKKLGRKWSKITKRICLIKFEFSSTRKKENRQKIVQNYKKDMPYLNLKSKERDNKKGVRYNGYKAYFWITSFLILSSYQSSAHLLPVLAVPDSVRSAQWRQWRHRYSKVPRCTVVDGAENSLQIHAKQQVQNTDPGRKKGL